MARYLDGLDHFAGGDPALTYPFTVAGHFNGSVGGSDVYLWCYANTSVTNNYFGLYVQSGSKLAAVARDSGGSRVWATTATLTSSTAYHVAAVFTSATSIASFINADSTGAYDSTGTRNPSSVSAVAIGALKRTTVGSYVIGTFAEWGMWDVALSAGELAMLSAGHSPLLVRPQNLVNYWPLFGRSGAAGNEDDWVGGLSLTQNGSPALADHPRIIYPRRRSDIWVPAAASTVPTLSASTYVPGSLTSTGWRPQITAS